ncbi:hypothetical protein HYH03_003898 [Edaphochlamys debaryana]|uniref:Trehalase n=1 Tax=Edaphochlamys debaryana TaxID=47281 RepID=A0A835YG72_9CHLO|nr:hypothetical protein HYH03_003898 [Edaphochlamys debaryana]|eukprot:KAG2498140.1 hypothetical protein HYH03_003898 [Edaphochlamys debaryana]
MEREELQRFVAAEFGDPGSDLKTVLPPGWHEAAPTWVGELPDPELRDLGAAVHGLWSSLCRQACSHTHPDRHTLLPLPHPFIVPGDRFRECYNWDSYWIIQGLLASELVPAAEALVRNLLHLVDVWGFVPNGARSYYTNRSQPPLLSAMVLSVWTAAADDRLLEDALPRLIKQHRYWTSGPKAVRIRPPPANGCCAHPAGTGGADATIPNVVAPDAHDEVMLSRYYAEWCAPRPESYREDAELVARAGLSGAEAEALYRDIASAAESGWDFSSRWMVGGDALEYTRTTQVIPADLNAWLYRFERDIVAVASHLGRPELAKAYGSQAEARLRAMDRLMWSEADGCWHDLLLTQPQPGPRSTSSRPTSEPAEAAGSSAAGASGGSPGHIDEPTYAAEQRPGAYASNWVPLWCGCAERGSSRAAAAVSGLLRSGLIQPGGLSTSLVRSGQQWDAPNAWPPLVHMAVEALAEAGVPEGERAAAELACCWVAAAQVGWRTTGHMHEKYSAEELGGVGGGGEYAPQVGFGWSNGVLLALMQRFCRRGGAAGGPGGGSA